MPCVLFASRMDRNSNKLDKLVKSQLTCLHLYNFTCSSVCLDLFQPIKIGLDLVRKNCQPIKKSLELFQKKNASSILSRIKPGTSQKPSAGDLPEDEFTSFSF